MRSVLRRFDEIVHKEVRHMTFTVTYRGEDGSPKTETVVVADRMECLAHMKLRGVTVLGVKEGGPASNRTVCGGRGCSSKNSAGYKRARSGKREGTGGWRNAVACGFIVILATGTGIWLWMEHDRGQRFQKPEIQKKVASTNEVKPLTFHVVPEVVPATNATPVEDPKKEFRKAIAKLANEERRHLAFEEMKNRKIPLFPKTNRIFRTGVEASMARIFMTRLGDPPPPMFTTVVPLRDEANLAEILIAANPVLDTDTEAQRESKEMVSLAKKEMIDYIKKGGEPEEFLRYYHGKLQEAFDLRRESAKSFMSMAREDPSIAGEYLKLINKELANKGIRQIELNERQRKRLELE